MDRKDYWDKYYRKTDLSKNPNLEIFKKFFEKYEKEIKSPILEIGCGEGKVLGFLQNKGFRDLYGIEISEVAKQISRKNSPQSTIFLRDIYRDNFNLKKDYFNLVISSMSLHHNNYKGSKNVLEKMAKHTNKNGLIYILTRSDSSLKGDERKIDISTYFIDYLDYSRVHFNKESIKNIVPENISIETLNEIKYLGRKNSLVTSWEMVARKR